MNRALKGALDAYRQYRAATGSRFYRAARYLVLILLAAYLLAIIFPQLLLAHEIRYKSYTVHAGEPLDQNIYRVLDEAEARLATSPLNDESVPRNVYLCQSRAMYAFLSNKAYRSSANSIPLIDNILVNRSNVAGDFIYPSRASFRPRSLGRTIAHEVTHLLIRKRYGYLKTALMPAWKKEGYCEYVGGETNVDYETGVRLWRANPQDAVGYAYFKYYMMVKYLLEVERLSVDELFQRSFDAKELEAKVLKSL